MKSTVLAAALALVIATTGIVSLNTYCRALDRNPYWGYWVCSNHHHVIKKIDFQPEMLKLTEEYQCTGWYVEKPR